MMRVAAEQRLQDMQLESDSCRARLAALQDEFRKMEEMVSNMLQYKAKIDQLRQENANMKSSYENNLQKYCSHLSTMERDNAMLMNQVKKMESQLHGKGDDRDKSKLLLERLKMVEAENSALVLENEQQRQQYEKCLDEIANQVVQALLAQKTLREECLKLQSRVQDLELQNKHLNLMFQQRMKCTSDTLVQSHICRTSAAASSSATIAALAQGGMTLDFLDNAGSLQSMCSEIMGDDSPGKPQLSSPPPWLKDTSSPAADLDQTTSHSSPSTSSTCPSTPEAKEHVVQTKIETEFPATNTSPKVKHINVYERRTRSLERGSSGPFSWLRRAGKGGNRSRKGSETQDRGYIPSQRLKQSTSADAISNFGISNKVSPSDSQLLMDALRRSKSSTGSQDRLTPQNLSRTVSKDDVEVFIPHTTDINHQNFEAFNKSFEKLLSKHAVDDNANLAALPSKHSTSSQGSQTSHVKNNQAGPYQNQQTSKRQMQQSSLPQKQRQLQERQPLQPSSKSKGPSQPRTISSAPVPALRNPFVEPLKSPKSPTSLPGQYYYYDYSDEDSDSRPVSRDFSNASTMSLNELLDSSMEGEVPLDDDFFSDWSSVCITPGKRIDRLTGQTISNNAMESKGRVGSSSSSSRSRSTSSSPETSGAAAMLKGMSEIASKQQLKGMSPGIPRSASLASEAKHSLRHREQTRGDNRPTETSQSEMLQLSGPLMPKTVSQQAKTRVLESTATFTSRPNTTEVQAEVHAENIPSHKFKPSPSPSPNMSQRSHDQGYASKGSYSQSSPSPSPSISHRGTPPWLHNSRDPQAFSRNELLTLVINREAMSASPRSIPNGAGQAESPRLARPGQLILAPQDRNFNFQGFSSASSASSDDKSPLKMFESQSNVDMKSSVIEVKKDGTFVHSGRRMTESSSDQSSSVSASPSSPAASPSKIPPPIAKKPIRAVKPEARSPQKDDKDKSQDANGKFTGPGNTNITVGFLLQSQVFPENMSVAALEDLVKTAMRDRLKHHSGKHGHDNSTIFPTKSSDSSFENLRVERSGSKDDGYSTMSSDIHPEVMEKFGDTLSRKFSETDSEPPSSCNSKSSTLDNSQAKTGLQRDSDFIASIHDRSFDFPSDQDSALESSITAEMVTSSSSQISTSSLEHPGSPGSAQVSKIVKLFENDKSRSNHTAGTYVSSSQCRHKDHTATSPCKTSSNSTSSSSPGSPNSFFPPSFHQPESPRRLANQFQKPKSPGSPSISRKITPGNPKSPVKPFSDQTKPGPSLTAKHSNIPKPSSSSNRHGNKTVSEGNKIGHAKDTNANIKRLPKGFYSSTLKSYKCKLVKKGDGVVELLEDSNDNAHSNISQKQTLNTITNRNSRFSDSKNMADNCRGPSKIPVPSDLTNTSLDSFKSTESRVLDPSTSTVNVYVVSTNPVNNSNNHSSNTHDISNGPISNATLPYQPSSVEVEQSVTGIAHLTAGPVLTANHIQDNNAEHSSSTNGNQAYPALTNQHSLHNSLIVMTNESYQQISSDSETNDDDHASSNSYVTNKYNENEVLDFLELNDNRPELFIHVSSPQPSLTIPPRQFTSHFTTVLFNPLFAMNHSNQGSNNNETNAPLTTSTVIPEASVLTMQHTDHCSPLMNIAASNKSSISTRQRGISATKAPSDSNFRCLRRSNSENSIFPKVKSTSLYEELFEQSWDSGKVLERSRSVSEIDLCSSRQHWEKEQGQSRAESQEIFSLISARNSANLLYEESDEDHQLFSPSQFLQPASFSNHSLFQEDTTSSLLHPPTHHSLNQFLNLPLHRPQRILPHITPWSQTLRLDLSDVTELDEEGSELTTTHDSLDSSLTRAGALSDESPRLGVDEQKRFNSQFYSLCKVYSNSSLLSSGNESRERLSLTSLNEILSANRSFDDSEKDPECVTETMCEEDEVAIREFDKISRQIASLSKTVDELNHSLSSLNSGEFEPSGKLNLISPPLPTDQHGGGASDVIDGYHWVEDEFFLTSCNGEVVIDGSDFLQDDSFNDIFAQNTSFDTINTEDARNEFYRLPIPTSAASSILSWDKSSAIFAQSEIFAGTHFDTVKEKLPTKRKRKLEPPTLQRSGSDGDLRSSGEVAEKRRSMPIFHEIKGNSKLMFADKGTEKSSESMDDALGACADSNNDSDDSLASDIGLDHMMCQRLFGRKGRFDHSSSSLNRPVIDFRKFFTRYGDSEKDAMAAFNFLDDISLSESGSEKKRRFVGDCFINQPDVIAFVKSMHDSTSEISEMKNDACMTVKEMRDVGVDAMGRSQLSASFELFDQSFTEEHPVDLIGPAPADVGEFTNQISRDITTNQSLGSFDNKPIEGSKQHRNTFDFTSASNIDIVSQGGCNPPQRRYRSLSVQERCAREHSIDSSTLSSYSEFVAELKTSSVQQTAQSSGSSPPPPRPPPRRPIITNGTLHASLERQRENKSPTPPLPPPPFFDHNEPHNSHHHLESNTGEAMQHSFLPGASVCAERSHFGQRYVPLHTRHHVPYVNQSIPPPMYKNLYFPSPRPLSDSFTSANASRLISSSSSSSPPPLPPRQPQISRTRDGRPQVLIRPHNIRQDNSRTPRPHSFNHYLIDKSKAALSTSSSSNPEQQTQIGRPRSHSEIIELQKRRPHQTTEATKSKSDASRIPRRKLRTRRERSLRKNSNDLATGSGDNGVKVGGSKQWRDIDVKNGKELSDSSDGENSSS